MEMDQDVAQVLFTQGATLVLLDVPTGTDVGIDIKSWNVAGDFKGIKMIPPGIHYVHYSAVKYGETAPRIGFFHNFKKCEFLVKKWDSKEEDISSEPVPEETVQSLKDNSKELDRYLGPYPYEIWKQWQELTSRINASLVERCSPLCGYVRSSLELEYCSDASRPRGGESETKRRRRSGRLTAEDKEEELLPDLKPKPGTQLRLTEIPDERYPEDATPSEITRYSLDSSYTLNATLAKLREPIEIVGEMQLTFICFLAGQSLDAFEQWKKLVSLICDADHAIPQYRSVYLEFLQTLEVELTYVPEEILCDIVASSNFVYKSLCKLFGNIESNTEVDGRLRSYAKRLQERLTAKFLWDFSNLLEDADDEAPVIVTLT